MTGFRLFRTLILSSILVLTLTATPAARAHCDSMDGPVVMDAKRALEAGDLEIVLKWIAPADETELRRTFDQVLAVRKLGPEAQKLADRSFFETLVRLHRASEGEPYTGLKPAGTDPGVAVRLADHALEEAEVEPLLDEILNEVRRGLKSRFHEAYTLKAGSDDEVETGRAYVAAYVEFVHYAKRLHEVAVGMASVEAHSIHGYSGAGHDSYGAAFPQADEPWASDLARPDSATSPGE